MEFHLQGINRSQFDSSHASQSLPVTTVLSRVTGYGIKLLPTSPDVPGLLLVVSSPVPSSFRARRNSLLRSGPRRISFSLDGAMSMGGVVLEGCCSYDGTTGRERRTGWSHEKEKSELTLLFFSGQQ